MGKGIPSRANNVSLGPTPPIDIVKAANDFEYYASHLLYIRTKAREYRLFNRWYPSQWRIWNSIKADLHSGTPVRKIILKPRQAGASTLTEALLWWQVHTVPQTHALVLSMDKDSAQYIFEMARNFYESLPDAHRPMKRYSSKKEIVLENPDEKTRHANPGLRSRIEVQTAGKYVPPRGANFNLVHFSEVAFWPNAEDIVPAIIPMVPYLPGTMVVYESTANGVDNFFKDAWDAARRGDSAFDPIFFPWHIMPEYAIPFYDPREAQEFASELDEEEQELIQKHKLSLEQLNWRRFKITEMEGDTDKFKQEYPSTEDEAFIFSGTPIFDRKVLKKVRTRDPIWEGDIDLYSEKILKDDYGLLKVWEHPIEKAEYVIGVDTSSGSSDDYSCMCVLKRTWPAGLCDQVAEWHGKIDPVALGKLSVILAKHYNNAMLSIEINNHGLTTQNEAQRSYWHFYRWQYFDRIGRTYTQKLGFETNCSTKPLLVDRTRACLRDSLVGIASEGLLQELWQYVRLPGTISYEAESGHDDRVSALMLGIFTLYIEDPNANFVFGAGEAIIAPGAKAPEMKYETEVKLPPIWDSSDPRGSITPRQRDWRYL